MKRILFWCVMLGGLLSACRHEPVPETISAEEYQALVEKSAFIRQDNSDRAVALRRQLMDIVFDKVEAVGGRLVLTVDSCYFIERGIPGFFCAMIAYDLKEMQDWMERETADGRLPAGQGDCVRLYEEAKRQYWEHDRNDPEWGRIPERTLQKEE